MTILRKAWHDIFLTTTTLALVSVLLAQSSQIPCCQWKCFPTAGQSSCQQQGGTGMCRYYSDQWGNGDECIHAPPMHNIKAETSDTWIGQCVVCCDSDGDGVPDTPIDDPSTPNYDWKMNLWMHERIYWCGLTCYGEFTTGKSSGSPAEPIPVPVIVIVCVTQ